MSLRLPSKSTPGAGLRAVLATLARRAKADVERLAGDPERRIHDLRTGMKKYRSLLRLAGGFVDERVERALRDRIRVLKEGVAGFRDEAVIARTARKIFGEGAAKVRLKPLNAGRKMAPPEALLAAAEELIVLTGTLDFDGLGRWELTERWRHSCRRTRRQRKRAARTAKAHDFHRWRKRAKDLWYQSAALCALDAKIGAAAKPAKKLSEWLGVEHDLIMLLAAVEGTAAAEKSKLQGELERVRERALAKDFRL